MSWTKNKEKKKADLRCHCLCSYLSIFYSRSKWNNLKTATEQLGTSGNGDRNKDVEKTKSWKGWTIARHVNCETLYFSKPSPKRQTPFLFVTASGQKWFCRETLQTAHEDEKITQMRRLTFNSTLLRYSDRDVVMICNFQSFLLDPHLLCSSCVNNDQPQTQSVGCLCLCDVAHVWLAPSQHLTRLN